MHHIPKKISNGENNEFTKEIEEALLSKSVDLAVHSHKDLETTPPEGLVIASVPIRANVEDILLISNQDGESIG